MAILANRVRIKSNLLDLGKFALFILRKFFIVILIVASCFFLYFFPPKSLSNILLESTGRVMYLGNSIYEYSSRKITSFYTKFRYFRDLEAENAELKLQLSEAKKDQKFISYILLENQNLNKLLKVVSNIKNDFITAKIVGVSTTPFASFATIRAGKNHNINVNDIVRGTSGIIGRVSQVSDNYATVMLANDHNSRIPVITEESKVKGIVAKQNDQMKMIYLKKDHAASVGEIVYTSGDGRIFPRGIGVATIEAITPEGALVKMLEDIDTIEFVVVEFSSERNRKISNNGS